MTMTAEKQSAADEFRAAYAAFAKAQAAADRAFARWFNGETRSSAAATRLQNAAAYLSADLEGADIRYWREHDADPYDALDLDTNERKRAARAAAKLAPAAPPLDPVEDDGRRYPIDEWHRLFGRPRVAWAEQYDHHPAPNPQEGPP